MNSQSSQASELSDDWGEISDAELLNVQSEYLDTAPPQNQKTNLRETQVVEELDDARVQGAGAAATMLGGGQVNAATMLGGEAGERSSPARKRKATPQRSPMERFWRRYLSVTDVCRQVWCELQVAYGYEIPHLPKRKEELNVGARIHLARELEVHKVVPVRASTREDWQAFKFLSLLGRIPALQAGQCVRELPVFGVLQDVFLVGVIDELLYNDNGQLVLSELKTRQQNSMPGLSKGHCLQVGLYKLLFDGLVQGTLERQHVIDHLRLRPEQALGAGVVEWAGKLGFQVGSTFGELLDLLVLNLSRCEVPSIDLLRLEFCHQGSGSLIGYRDIPFTEELVRADLQHYLSYWGGQREPRGVDIEDAWKCGLCNYKELCEWRRVKLNGTVTLHVEKKFK